MRALRALGASFAVLRLVETTKEALPVIPPPWAKSTFTVALSAGIVALYDRSPRTLVLESLAVAGAASLLHDLQDGARRFTDNQITQVMQRQPRRAPSL